MTSYTEAVKILTDCISGRNECCYIPFSSLLWLDDAFSLAKINSPKSFDVHGYDYCSTGMGVRIRPHYSMNPKQYSEVLVDCNKKVSEILAVVWDDDPFSLIENLYEYTCKTMRYSIQSESYSIVGPLLYNRGVCEGFTKYFNYFCQIAGIESTAALGHLKKDPGIGHAWNQIKLDGKWYNLDVTSDLSFSKDGYQTFNYFLIDDDKIQLTHTFDHPSKGCIDSDLDYHVRMGLRFTSPSQLREKLHGLKRSVTFSFDVVSDDLSLDYSQRILSIVQEELEVPFSAVVKKTPGSQTYVLTLEL